MPLCWWEKAAVFVGYALLLVWTVLSGGWW